MLSQITLLCMTVIIAFNILTGIIGYAAFGDDVEVRSELLCSAEMSLFLLFRNL